MFEIPGCRFTQPLKLIFNVRVKSTYFLSEHARIKKGKSDGKVPWSNEENAAIMAFFNSNIQSSSVPGKVLCEAAAAKYDVLKRRSWVVIKSKVANLIKKH